MITKTYAPPPVEVKGPLEVAHLKTSNGAHLHARRYPGYSFDISMADGGSLSPSSDGWHFDAEDCDEAIEFFTLLRDDLNNRKDT
jgi:hypothetical protein